MQNQSIWRYRLKLALAEKNLSWRRVSIKAGLSAGYLAGVFSGGKDPTIANLNAICAAAELDPVEIMFGKADAA